MVATITPFVKGGGRRTFWSAWIGHAVAGGLAGALMGYTLGRLGALLQLGAGGQVVAAALTAAYAGRELGLIRLPLIDLHRAVPFSWRTRYGRVRASWLYGFALALGFTARTPFSSYHLCLLWLVVAGDPAIGAFVLASYGVTRALAPLFAHALLPTEAPADRMMGALEAPAAIHLVNGALMALIGGYALMSLLGH